jgi:hypothetical protein
MTPTLSSDYCSDDDAEMMTADLDMDGSLDNLTLLSARIDGAEAFAEGVEA